MFPRSFLAAACLVLLAGCAQPSRRLVLVPATAADVHAIAGRGDARATLVNVWATWCDPCRQEFPELLAAAAAHRRDHVRLVLVSADFPDQRAAVEQFLTAQGVHDTVWIKAEDDMTFIDGLHPRWSGALPATVVYDRAGRVSAFWEGQADRGRFESAITEALASRGATEGGSR